MPDKFDPYREKLVVETRTVWPEQYDELEPTDKYRIEAALHAQPEQCAQLEYIRQHTGFTRQITVTQADLDRVSGMTSPA